MEVERPKVALIGRPNVGKSTLFNRFIGAAGRRGGRSAIVDELPGVTRDRLYGKCEWNGYEFTVVDSGGIGPESEDPLLHEVADNARVAMHEADLIVMVVDARSGMTLSDEAVLKELRKLKKPVVVAANKVDNAVHEPDAAEFWGLGYTDMAMISGQSGRGTGDLLDLIVERLDWSQWPEATPAFIKQRYEAAESRAGTPAGQDEAGTEGRPTGDAAATGPTEAYPFSFSEMPTARFVPDESWRDEPLRLIFLGRQNVGKSSLTNALLGEKRALVADLPGTTRDPLWAAFEHDGKPYELLDTAGMKRISRMKEDVDFYSFVRAGKVLKGSEVALLTLDAQVGITEQDKRVASLIEDEKRAIVIVVNKSDLITLPLTESEELEMEYGTGPPPKVDDKLLRESFVRYTRANLGKLRWADVVFTSAVEGTGLDDMLEAARRSRENFHRRIDNKALQAVLKEAITLSPPPIVKNRELRFFDFRQIGNCPPAFLVEINDKLLMRQAYRRFLERQIRKHFDYAGTHIEMVIYEKRGHGGRKRKA